MIENLAFVMFGYSIGILVCIITDINFERKFKKLYQWQQGITEELKILKYDTTRSRNNRDSKEGDTSRD